MSRRAVLIQHVMRSGFDGRSKPASQQTENSENNTGANNFDPTVTKSRFRSNMSRAVVMAGASPHRSRQNMQRTTLAGAILIQHVTKSGFDPSYELLARQRKTVMLRHVKPTRPGQHQQHQRTRPGQHQQHRRRPVFPLPKSGPKQAPLATGFLSSFSWGIAEKNRQS